MTSAVNEYFDRERDDLLHWMDFLAKLLAGQLRLEGETIQ